MSEENAQKKNKFRPVVFGCLIPSAGFLVLAIIAALLLSRAEPPGKKPEYIKSAEPRIEQRISNVEKRYWNMPRTVMIPTLPSWHFFHGNRDPECGKF